MYHVRHIMVLIVISGWVNTCLSVGIDLPDTVYQQHARKLLDCIASRSCDKRPIDYEQVYAFLRERRSNAETYLAYNHFDKQARKELDCGLNPSLINEFTCRDLAYNPHARLLLRFAVLVNKQQEAMLNHQLGCYDENRGLSDFEASYNANISRVSQKTFHAKLNQEISSDQCDILKLRSSKGLAEAALGKLSYRNVHAS